jgi:hypothetical protein
MQGGRLTPKAYQNAAHELFHAVQLASRFHQGSNKCEIGKWITEGTADAVGFDMARRVQHFNLSAWGAEGQSWRKPWGAQIYYEPLNSSPGDGYQTSSFWRHLAEWNAAAIAGQEHAGSGQEGMNYGYLVDLFSHEIPGTGADAELRWLDDWMKSHKRFSAGLPLIFAQFISTYGDLWRARIRRVPGFAEGDSFIPRWLQGMFGKCQRVSLTDATPSQRVSFNIDAVAARCLEIKVSSDGYIPKLVVIDNSNMSLGEANQLYIGAVGGQLVSRADVRTAEPPSQDAGKTFAKWQFLVSPGTPNYFVLVNIASKPVATTHVQPELAITVPQWESSMTSQATPATGGTAEQPRTRKDVRKYQKTLRANPTTQSAAAAMSGVDPQPADPGCTQELQSVNLCGPQLNVALTRDFGMVPGEGPVASTGGVMDQMGAIQMESIDEAAIMAQMNSMAGNNTGNAINISIPVIGYGETGTFDKARINVTGKMEGDIADTYSSISPTPVSLASGSKVYPPNGVVTITEYTSHVLRGSFNATLVSKEAAKNAGISWDNPVLPTMGSINGSFTVAAPWRGNGARPDVGHDSAMMAGIRDDVMGILLKIPESMRGQLAGGRMAELCQLGFEPAQLEALGMAGNCSGESAMTAFAERCDCNCSNWEVIRDMESCATECDAKWQIWACGPYLETGLGELDDETQRYQTEAQHSDVPENVWQPWVLIFHDASPDIRAELWNELENYKAQHNPAEIAERLAEIEQERAEREQRVNSYDSETRNYRDALRAAGYSDDEVKGLTEVFAVSPPAMRQVYWNSIGTGSG